LVLFDIFVISNQYSQGYGASLLDKVKRLQEIQEPKIILVGHSNLAFGINSELIEAEIGMPVVNLGFHGGLGNSFHERIARLCINEGDIVVVCHSTYADDDTIDDVELAWTTIEWYPELWKLMRFSDIVSILEGYPKYLYDAGRLWVTNSGNVSPGGVYSRDAFNQNGDVSLSRTENKYIFTRYSVAVPQINDTCINRLNELNDYVLSKNAVMVIAGYPIADGEYTPDKKEFEAFQQKLEEELDAPIISDFTDYFIPYSYFYDTQLHLTDEGVIIRTNQLIEDLQRFLQE